MFPKVGDLFLLPNLVIDEIEEVVTLETHTYGPDTYMVISKNHGRLWIIEGTRSDRLLWVALNPVAALASKITKPAPGYHLREITKHPCGTAGKVFEETEEFMDAVAQSNPVMALTELTDIVGAITAYLAIHHPTITMNDLQAMAAATARAFASGRR